MKRLGTLLAAAYLLAGPIGPQAAHAQSSHYLVSIPEGRIPRVCPLSVFPRHVNESGDLNAARYFVGRPHWGEYNEFFWRGYLQSNRGGWSNEAGFNRATDQWLPLARMYNALFALTYVNPNPNGPTRVPLAYLDCSNTPRSRGCGRSRGTRIPKYGPLVYGRYAWRISIQRGVRPSFECKGDSAAAYNSFGWVNFRHPFVWGGFSRPTTIGERAGIYYHEAVHATGQGHDGGSHCDRKVSCDDRFPSAGANTAEVRFLEEYAYCATGSTKFLRYTALAAANDILRRGFRIRGMPLPVEPPSGFCTSRGY